jgi:endonuclease/exonuclease/phosphatase family metal-dependent hydrolase
MTFEQTTKIGHDLHPHIPSLLDFHSTKSLEESELYRELKPRILKVLNSYELETLAPPAPAEPYYRAVAWNIERGMRFEEIIHFLKNHPVLSTADILLITEADLGMARSGNRNVAREIAEKLKMNYFFAPSYLNLAKGCGIEHEFEGENEIGIHGNAILSRYPIHKPRIVPLPNTHDKMKGREKRIGNQRALVATIDLAGEPLRVGCVHLDVRSTQKHRRLQLQKVVEAINAEQQENPTSGFAGAGVLIGGDWNTSTYDSHSTLSAIIGFWVRVFMGTGNMIRNHYLKPDGFFERKLFRMLEESGFDYKGCNEIGVGTNHYSVEDIKQFKNLREWIPLWCFKCIEWALKDHGGRCSFKLDWFAQKRLKILKEGEVSSDRKGPSFSPKVIGNLIHNGQSASDHDAIVVDFNR